MEGLVLTVATVVLAVATIILATATNRYRNATEINTEINRANLIYSRIDKIFEQQSTPFVTDKKDMEELETLIKRLKATLEKIEVDR